MKKCLGCGQVEIPPHATFCGRKCRQAAFRLRRRRTTEQVHGEPMRLAYADPPYPRLAKRYYGDQPNYAGEVNHAELVARLEREYPDGWALSTSMRALREVLPLCPPEAHVCPWVKPLAPHPQAAGLHIRWEPLIIVRGRQKKPGVRDWLRAQPARFGGDLPGRKPLAFVAFLFDALGLAAGDTFDDLYPGTGIVGRTWNVAARLAQPSLGLPGVAQRSSETASSTPSADGRRRSTSAMALRPQSTTPKTAATTDQCALPWA